jgi:hypothetical protein
MSCDYRIQGEATVRNTPKVMHAINQLASDVRGKDYLTVTQVDSSRLELSLSYDDITTIHTPAHFGSFLDAIAPAVIGCGVFEIETSGDTWTEWIGEDQAIKESKSRVALIRASIYLAHMFVYSRNCRDRASVYLDASIAEPIRENCGIRRRAET